MINMNRPLMLRCITAALSLLLLSGCADLQLGPPVSSVDNVIRARAAIPAPVAVGNFVPAKTLDPALDVSFDLRSNTLTAPTDSSFAKYLRETLITELKSANLLDPASRTVIQGELTASKLEAPISGTGIGELGARFTVSKAGKTVYERELKVSHNWPSPYLGMVAIPSAIGEYTTLHRRLVTQLLEDPDFKAALRK